MIYQTQADLVTKGTFDWNKP